MSTIHRCDCKSIVHVMYSCELTRLLFLFVRLNRFQRYGSNCNIPFDHVWSGNVKYISNLAQSSFYMEPKVTLTNDRYSGHRNEDFTIGGGGLGGTRGLKPLSSENLATPTHRTIQIFLRGNVGTLKFTSALG